MGLFNEDTPEEKKIKEIFGGIGGSRDFDKKLQAAEIDNVSNTWIKIKNQIKDEVKNENLTVDKIDIRTEELIKEFYENQTPEEKLKGKEKAEKIHQKDIEKLQKENERDLTSEDKKQKEEIMNNADFECSINEQRTGWNDSTRDEYIKGYVFIKENYLEVFKTGFWIKSNLGSKKLYYTEMSSVDFDKAGLMHITTSIFITMRGGEKIIFKFVKEEDYNRIVKKWEEFKNKQSTSDYNSSNAEELLKYAELLEKGLLTRDEFDEKKKELL